MMDLHTITGMDLVNMIQWTNENQFPIQGIMVEGQFFSENSEYLVNIQLYENHNEMNPRVGRRINAMWVHCKTAEDILEVQQSMNIIRKELEKAFPFTDVDLTTKYVK